MSMLSEGPQLLLPAGASYLKHMLSKCISVITHVITREQLRRLQLTTKLQFPL